MDSEVEDYPLSHFLEVAVPYETTHKKFHYKMFECVATLKNFEDAKDPEDLLGTIMEKLMNPVLAEKPTMISFSFWNDEMESPFYVPFRPPEQNNKGALLARLSNLTQSSKFLNLFNSKLNFKVTGQFSPSGSGIDDGDNDCLFKAIFEGIQSLGSYLGINKYQDVKTLSGLSEKNEYNLLDVTLIENKLDNFKIVIYNEKKKVIHRGRKREKVVHILLQDHHFSFIHDISTFLVSY